MLDELETCGWTLVMIIRDEYRPVVKRLNYLYLSSSSFFVLLHCIKQQYIVHIVCNLFVVVFVICRRLRLLHYWQEAMTGETVCMHTANELNGRHFGEWKKSKAYSEMDDIVKSPDWKGQSGTARQTARLLPSIVISLFSSLGRPPVAAFLFQAALISGVCDC